MANKGPDILFINPGDTKQVYQNLSHKFSAIEPPVFCGLFATFARRKGFSVGIIDTPAEELTANQTASLAVDMNPLLVVMVVYGFQPSASTQNMPSAGKICRLIKELSPDTKILITGTHPSALPERTLREEAVDFVCTKEGPHTIVQLAEALKSKTNDFSKVGDLCYFVENKVCFTEPLSLIKKFDEEMSGVAWDLLPMKKYRAHNWHCFDNPDLRIPYASIHTSLGCPYKCTFCCINKPYGGPAYRMWSPQQVVKEIDFLVRKYGIRNLKIVDEMFVLNEAHVLGICDGLIELGHDLNIWAYTRIDTTKDKFMDKLRRAGFRWLAIGIESGSKHVRDGADKKFKNERVNLLNVNQNIIHVVRKIQDAGMYAGCNYIFGLPDDTLETMQETLDLALEINGEYANFYSAMAYPGSPLYEMAREKKLALPDDPGGPGWIGYSQHSYETLPLPTNNVSSKDVLRFRDEAFLKYFTNPKYLEMMTDKFGSRTVEHIKEMTNLPKLKRKILED